MAVGMDAAKAVALGVDLRRERVYARAAQTALRDGVPVFERVAHTHQSPSAKRF